MEIHYTDGWFRAKKVPGAILDTEEARQAHERRRPYTVLVGSADHPSNFIELNDDYIGVGFLDDRLREYLTYTFAESHPKRLFLERATHREFDDNSDTLRAAKTYYFKPDGSVAMVDTVYPSGEGRRSESRFEPSGNWERYPDFGDYISLSRADR